MEKLNNVQDLLEIDRAHIWHPYAAPGAATHVVTSTSGTRLTMADGRQLIDAMSSWWAAIHGHGNPRLVEAAKKQIDTMSHVMFGGLTHEPAAQLTANLMELTRNEYSQVFYTDSGSVSVEVAIKMALQYSRGIGKPERTQLLTWRSGYHGDTFMAMSVCDPQGGMHAMWEGVVNRQIFAPAPPLAGAGDAEIDAYLEKFEKFISPQVAAVVIEPMVQGTGGMRFHDESLLRGIREVCDRREILLIADEIATGFGRTGALFATQQAGITPDIMCVGKALTGGFMTLAATLATEKVVHGMQPKALLHGPTFMANPLACAVAAEATAIIMEGTWQQQVADIEKGLMSGLCGVDKLPGVVDVRVRGAIGVIEMDSDVDMVATTTAAMNEGVWIRPFGRLIYVMPPYISTQEEIVTICQAMKAAAKAAKNAAKNADTTTITGVE